MFPGFLSMIIMYWVMKEIFHLQGSYWSLVIIYSAGAGGGYYISKGFFDTISKSIDEAAMIDGATKSQIFWQISTNYTNLLILIGICLVNGRRRRCVWAMGGLVVILEFDTFGLDQSLVFVQI